MDKENLYMNIGHMHDPKMSISWEVFVFSFISKGMWAIAPGHQTVSSSMASY